ncbi:MAG: DNA polymerase III subunit delta [Gammaproteobacteria bacterium]|nr:DNA polymerase III subunit delta [Gammaproteobacteria bacterium]
MKLYPEKLPAHLASGKLAPIYVLAGDEPLQVGEAADAVRAAAKEQGYLSREVFFAERGFDWQGLAAAGDSMSLFAEKRILELRLPTGKPGDAGAKALADLAARPPEDTILIVVAGRIERAPKWKTALEKAGVLVEFWPVDAAKLPGWIMQRMQAAGLAADREAAQLLADRVEGNLLAAAQEIDKLALLLQGQKASSEAIRQAVADSARFDVFQLVDAALTGDANRALRVLTGLQGEGLEPVLVTWALAREIRSLADMAYQLASGAPRNAVLGKVWPKKRQPVVERALQRLDVRQLEKLLLEAALVDRCVKGVGPGQPWPRLERLVAALAGKPLVAAS